MFGWSAALPDPAENALAKKISAYWYSFAIQVILPTASGTSNEGRSSPLLGPLPAVSWPRVPACGSLEPPRQDGENAQKTGEKRGKNGRDTV